MNRLHIYPLFCLALLIYIYNCDVVEVRFLKLKYNVMDKNDIIIFNTNFISIIQY